MHEKILTLKNISNSFSEEGHRRFRALKDISLEVGKGDFLSIVGPSGCGKSTLLRIMAGLVKPTSGSVERRAKVLSMVFQDFALFPWLTVLENVEYGLVMNGTPMKERIKIAKEKIAEVGLAGYEHKHPKELSGGQRQRVGFARALAISPEVLLLDEPFSSLDPFTTEVLKNDMFRLWQKYQMTVVMVTHQIGVALELSTDILVLSSHPGEVVERLHLSEPYPRNMRTSDMYEKEDSITKKIIERPVQ